MDEYLSSAADECQKNWQRLPFSLSFTSPLPIKARLVVSSGTPDLEPREFKSLTAALRYVINQGGKMVLLEGGPGQGKTAAMLWAMHEMCLDIYHSSKTCNGETLFPNYQDLGKANIPKGKDYPFSILLDKRPKCLRDVKNRFFVDNLDVIPTDKFLVESDQVREEAVFWQENGHAFVFGYRTADTDYHVRGRCGWDWIIKLDGLDERERDLWLESQPNIKKYFDKLYEFNPSVRRLSSNPLIFSMLLSYALNNYGAKFELQTDDFPGRAGLFAGFIKELFAIAKKIRKDANYDCYSDALMVLEEECWGALRKGMTNTIPGKMRRSLRCRRFPQTFGQQREAEVLLKNAGIIEHIDTDGSLRFNHQEFVENFAGRHLARRLNSAYKNGSLSFELWDHLSNPHLDNLVVHSLGQMDIEYLPGAMKTVYYLLKDHYFDRCYQLLQETNKSIALSIIDKHPATNKFFKPRKNGSRPQDTYSPSNILDADGEETNFKRDKKLGVPVNKSIILGRIEIILAAMKDPDDDIRVFASYLLSYVNDIQAVPALIAAINDANPFVKQYAIRGLGNMETSIVVRTLLDATKDTDLKISSEAEEAIRKLPKYVKSGTLLDVLASSDRQLLPQTIRAIGYIKETEAVGYLVKLLHDGDYELRMEAAKALNLIDGINDLSLLRPVVNVISLGSIEKEFEGQIVEIIAKAIIKNRTVEESMIILEAISEDISDKNAIDISSMWRRRWCGSKVLPVIKAQRLLQKKEDTSMVTIDQSVKINNINANGPGNLAIGAHSSAVQNNHSDEGAYQILKEEFRKGQGIKEGFQISEALNMLDALQAAHGKPKSEKMDLLDALQGITNVATLSALGCQALALILG